MQNCVVHLLLDEETNNYQFCKEELEINYNAIVNQCDYMYEDFACNIISNPLVIAKSGLTVER